MGDEQQREFVPKRKRGGQGPRVPDAGSKEASPWAGSPRRSFSEGGISKGGSPCGGDGRRVKQGSKGGTPLGRDTKGGTLFEVKQGSRGRLWSPICEGHCVAMYNLALPFFLTFLFGRGQQARLV